MQAQVYASMSAAPCLWMDFAASRFKPYAVTAGATDMVLPFIAQVSLAMSRQPAACLARFRLSPLCDSLTVAQSGCSGHAPSLQPAHNLVGRVALTVTQLHALRPVGQSAQPSQQQWPLCKHYLATAGPPACPMA